MGFNVSCPGPGASSRCVKEGASPRISYFLSITKWDQQTKAPIWPPGSRLKIRVTASPLYEETLVKLFTKWEDRSDLISFRTTALTPEDHLLDESVGERTVEWKNDGTPMVILRAVPTTPETEAMQRM